MSNVLITDAMIAARASYMLRAKVRVEHMPLADELILVTGRRGRLKMVTVPLVLMDRTLTMDRFADRILKPVIDAFRNPGAAPP